MEGKAPPLNVRCGRPGCSKFATERHHLFPRSYLRGQPYEWVSLPGDLLLANSIGLCTDHHNRVTGGVGGHKSKIVWEDEEFVWYDATHADWKLVGPLLTYASPEGDERCPACGHITHKGAKPSERRKAKTWAVIVPDDEEDGAVVLDSYVEDFAGIFGFSDESARLRRYHVLARVLQWASVNRIDLIREWEEAAD